MNSNNYIPREIEIPELPESMISVVEDIAEAVHDSWSTEKTKLGYTYAPVRCDDPAVGLTHPLLKPYAELSESDKELDRATARTTVAMLIALGYQIRKA